MTEEQKASLDRVKAQLAYGHYNSDGIGSYSADDIEKVLAVIASFQETIGCVKADLSDLRDVSDEPHTKEFLTSTLKFLEME